jgi:hypothetical protein
MDPISAAIAAFDAQDPEEKLSYNAVADMYGVSPSTLARSH